MHHGGRRPTRHKLHRLDIAAMKCEQSANASRGVSAHIAESAYSCYGGLMQHVTLDCEHGRRAAQMVQNQEALWDGCLLLQEGLQQADVHEKGIDRL